MIYRADWELVDRRYTQSAPLRILFLTSIRDTGQCDRNGTVVDTPQGQCYMEGVIERAVKESHPGGFLHDVLEVVGVITDDVADGKTGDYPTLPARGQPWIYPLDLKNPDGTSITDLTWNLPSCFRKLPRADVEGRRLHKQCFEQQVLELMRQTRAHVIVSDHYMAKIEHLVNGFGLFGRVLNIHPAITVQGHPFAFPGQTPTADAIARAKNGNETWTGATLHIMDTEIDHGPPIAFMCSTPVHAHDEPQHLRARNYPNKCRVFVSGMIHYTRHIYPYLGRLNFGNMTERAWIGGK